MGNVGVRVGLAGKSSLILTTLTGACSYIVTPTFFHIFPPHLQLCQYFHISQCYYFCSPKMFLECNIYGSSSLV